MIWHKQLCKGLLKFVAAASDREPSTGFRAQDSREAKKMTRGHRHDHKER
ncbi:MAG TPA: hypothetical protein PLO78_06390 [Candidatus Omnitrophota bacterium]|nr:hypothetical protein [Candidatus Omnitrophota bacterium]